MKHWIWATMALPLGACGLNQLRVEYAGNVARAGELAQASSGPFFDEVAATRREMAIELIALDSNCMGNVAVFREPRTVGQSPSSSTTCYPEGEAGQHPGAARIELSSPTAEQFAPLLQSLQVLATYTEALAQIVDAAPPDLSTTVNGVVDDSKAAASLAESIGLAKIDVASQKARVDAATALVQMLVNLANEEQQVEHLRSYVKKHHAEADQIAETLQRASRRWVESAKSERALAAIAEDVILRQEIGRNAKGDPSARAAILRSHFDRMNALGRQQLASVAFVNALKAVREENGNLASVIVDRPHLTRAEHAKKALYSRRRVMAALQSLTDVLTTFKGI